MEKLKKQICAHKGSIVAVHQTYTNTTDLQWCLYEIYMNCIERSQIT